MGDDVGQLTLDGAPDRAPRYDQVEAARLSAKVVVDPRPGGCSYWVGVIGSDGGRHTAAGPPGSGPG